MRLPSPSETVGSSGHERSPLEALPFTDGEIAGQRAEKRPQPTGTASQRPLSLRRGASTYRKSQRGETAYTFKEEYPYGEDYVISGKSV